MKRKLITFLVVIVIAMLLVPSSIYAKMDTSINISSTAAGSSKEMTKRILGMVQAIGSVVSVVALVIIGIRYMISSVEEKANMKGVLVYYIVGAVLVFATSNILGVAWDLLYNKLKY